MKINLLGYCVLVASLAHATLSYPSQENIYNPAYVDDYFSPTEPAQLEPGKQYMIVVDEIFNWISIYNNYIPVILLCMVKFKI